MSSLQESMATLFGILERSFAEIDQDGSGSITIRELVNGMYARRVRQIERIEEAVRRTDCRGDNLTFANFALLWYYWPEFGDYEEVFGRHDGTVLKQCFDFLEHCYIKFDADKSLSLSKDELSRFIVAYFSVLPPGFDALCDEHFPSADTAPALGRQSANPNQISFKMFLMLLYKLCCPGGKYHFSRPRRRPSMSSGRAEDQDLWRLLKQAFAVVEQDFRRFDIDGDNAVDMHEMTTAMRANSRELVLNISKLQHLFAEVDIDNSGFVDFKEFLYLTYMMCADGSYKAIVQAATDAAAVKTAFLFLRNAYSEFDKDNSGRLDEGELTQFATKYFGSVPPGLLDGFHRVMNPTKRTIDLVKFFSLLYALVCPNGMYVNKPKVVKPASANPNRADLPPPKPVGNLPRRIMPLDTRKIVKGKELGKGGFGVVYKCTIDGQECAAKYLLGQYSPEVHEDFRKECAYMEKFSDPNIVFLVGYAANPPELCIVTELCTGSLFDVIQKQGRMLSTPTIIRVANEIAMGLKTLHAAGMIHRDLKSLNVLIDAGMHAKVADLGLSTDKASGTHTQGVIGTPLWSAPEVLRGDKYDNKADVYSYGIMLYEMTHLQLPYYDQPPNMNKIMHEVAIGQLRPRIRQGTHGGLAALMQRCWQQDARARPSMDEIITTLNGMQA